MVPTLCFSYMHGMDFYLFQSMECSVQTGTIAWVEKELHPPPHFPDLKWTKEVTARPLGKCQLAKQHLRDGFMSQKWHQWKLDGRDGPSVAYWITIHLHSLTCMAIQHKNRREHSNNEMHFKTNQNFTKLTLRTYLFHIHIFTSA